MSDILRYFRTKHLPHLWCPGCGHGTVLGALVRAVEKVGLDQDKTVIVSGIGCSSRAPGYLDFDTLHTTHGRALAFATGVKFARPELKVIVITGDGDLAAIGGNHLIHAARRNIDLTTVCFNNSIYGMTSGQYSPLTPLGSYATTSPYGTLDRAFDLPALVAAAGAPYVGRSTTYHVSLLIDLIAEALTVNGFSFVEAVTQCPTYFGRKNKIGDAVKMLTYLKENSVNIDALNSLSQEEREKKIVIGRLHRSDAPEYTEAYRELVEKLSGGVGGDER
jgi:2-oxoglutarate ferredoxin oxidoreductase subunit beta